MNNATLYTYNNATRKFTIPTDPNYEYCEKDLLAKVNSGYFGFGTPVKLGSYLQTKPYSYDYYTDYQRIRFSSMDEATGKVNKDAINTYDKTYYFYYNYYTYNYNPNSWSDTTNFDE